jgi:phage replication O-like protein O
MEIKQYTRIDNILFDKFLPVLSGNAIKVFLIITRKTIGWHKETDIISNLQLLKLTGITCRHRLLQAIDELIKLNIIKVIRSGSGKNIKTSYKVIHRVIHKGDENDPIFYAGLSKVIHKGGENTPIRNKIEFNGGENAPYNRFNRGESTPIRLGLMGVNSPPTKESKEKKKERKAANKLAVVCVFEYWKKIMNHPMAILDEKRAVDIQRALKAFPEEQLLLAIDGCRLSSYHMGQNNSKTIYDGLHLIFKNAENIEKFRDKAVKAQKVSKQLADPDDLTLKCAHSVNGVRCNNQGTVLIYPNWFCSIHSKEIKQS